MNKPTLDYWSGPSHPSGWRRDLFWPYAGGIAGGSLVFGLVLCMFSGVPGRIIFGEAGSTCVLSLVGATLLLGAAEVRVRALHRTFHVRSRLRIAFAGSLHLPALIGTIDAVRKFATRDTEVTAIMAAIAVVLAYHAAAAILLIRPDDARAPAAFDPSVPAQPEFPLAQLADPPENTAAPLPPEKGSENA